MVAFLQNHDQVGNRALGERIAALAPRDAVAAATAVLLIAPSLPLIFMGQEWAASAPFRFFRAFEHAPDASGLAAFAASALDWAERERPPHRQWLELHRQLLRMRLDEIVPRIEEIAAAQASYERLRRAWSAGALAHAGRDARARCEPQCVAVRRVRSGAPGSRAVRGARGRFAGGVAPAWGVR